MAVFGGIEYDLRQASTTKNQMTIDANALFGGVELQVPTSWTVILKGVAVFGGYEDKTAPPPPGAGPELIVTGHAIFGGVSITN
jgi:hypothetical protein